jgi:hypothetical protein
VAEAWLDIELEGAPSRRQDLKRGLTMVGGKQGDVPLAASGADRLHVWDDPPKLIFVGSGARPAVNGVVCDECELHSGDVIEWYGARMGFGSAKGVVSRETAAPKVASAAPAPFVSAPTPAGMPSVDEQMWRRVRAGMLVELGLGSPKAAARWQDASRRNEFEPDACARDILASQETTDVEGPLLERTSSLLRELLMAPVAARRAERRTPKPKRMNIFLIVLGQLIVLSTYALVVLIALFVLRQRWHLSIDTFLDKIIHAFT